MKRNFDDYAAGTNCSEQPQSKRGKYANEGTKRKFDDFAEDYRHLCAAQHDTKRRTYEILYLRHHDDEGGEARLPTSVVTYHQPFHPNEHARFPPHRPTTRNQVMADLAQGPHRSAITGAILERWVAPNLRPGGEQALVGEKAEMVRDWEDHTRWLYARRGIPGYLGHR